MKGWARSGPCATGRRRGTRSSSPMTRDGPHLQATRGIRSLGISRLTAPLLWDMNLASGSARWRIISVYH
eukprot:4250777-Pyramimonas_sp.AAC.1